MESSLNTYDQMNTHFNQLCTQSRYQLRKQLLSKHIEDQSFQLQLTKAFNTLYNTMTNNNSLDILTKLKQLFQIDQVLLAKMNEEERKKYVTECIKQSISFDLEQIGHEKKVQVQRKRVEQKEFSWLDLNTKYQYLKPMFQQILLQKIRWFDQQLSQSLTTFYQTQNKEQKEEQTQFDPKHSTMNSTVKCMSSSCGTKYCTISNRKINVIKDKMQNVAIRNQSKFLKTQWTKQDQQQFMNKKKQLISRFKKGSKIPIIYQFVKKYTETNKGRDLLLNKWRKNQQVTEEQLRYLCATSVFLNQSINKKQKNFIGQKLDKLDQDLVCQLESNIAEKIIQTYKQFMAKVSNIRSNYYIRQSEKTKKQLESKDKQIVKQIKNKTRYQELLKYKKIFLNICNSKSLKWKFNQKVSRWVYLFADKLKLKCRINKKRGTSNVIKRLTASKSERVIELKNRVQTRSIKFFKPILHSRLKTQQLSRELNTENHQTFISKSRTTKSITLLKTTKSKSSTKFGSTFNRTQFTQRKVKQILEPFSIYICYPSYVIQKVLKIQSTWRMFLTKKGFKAKIKSYRHQKSLTLQKQIQKLRLIYPPYSKIDYVQVLKRINRTDMIKKFIQLTKTKLIPKMKQKLDHTYLYFSQQTKQQQQLQMAYKIQTVIKRKHNFERFIHYCNNNMFDKLMHSNLIFKGTDLNQMLDGKRALCCSIKNKNYRLTKMLLQSGVDTNLPDTSSQFPLHYAFKLGDIESIFLLLDYNADLNVTNSNDHTPLFYASQNLLKNLGLQNGVITNTYSNRQSFMINNSKLYTKSHDKKIQQLGLCKLQKI